MNTPSLLQQVISQSESPNHVQAKKEMNMRDQLRAMTDTELKDLISEIQGELVTREKERKKKAAADIKALADAAGLNVSIADKPRKRRGRPPKTEDQ